MTRRIRAGRALFAGAPTQKHGWSHESRSAPEVHVRCTMAPTLCPTVASSLQTALPIAPSGTLAPGSTLGPWRVTGDRHERAGRALYAVVHTVTARRGVLEIAPGADVERLRRVMLGTEQMCHPAALCMYDVGVLAGGQRYVVREPLDGWTLAAIVAERELPMSESLHIVHAIADALIAAHAVGLAHGGVTLDHVLVVENEEGHAIKLLDWGMTRAAADPSLPEDVRALGVMLEQLIEEPRPQKLDTLLAAMLADAAGTRPTLGEVARELAVMLDDLESLAVSAKEMPALELRLPRHHMSRRWRYRLLAGACLGLIVFLGVRPIGSGDRPRPVAAQVAPAAASSPMPTAVAVASEPVTRSTPAVAVASEPVIRSTPVLPSVAPATPARPENASSRVMTVKKPRAKARAVPGGPTALDPDRELLRRYQRVGHELITLERKVGYSLTRELSAQFREIRIDSAMATAQSRQAMAATLVDLEQTIDRIRPIEITDDCRNNPLAQDCR